MHKTIAKDLVVFNDQQFDNNSYLLVKNDTAVIIDVSFNSLDILNYLKQNHLSLKGIICTHAHFDHIGYATSVAKVFECEIFLNENEQDILRKYNLQEWLPGFFLDNDLKKYHFFSKRNLKIGNFNFEILPTPGHTPGSITLRYNHYLFTGDTLFTNSVGRTDLPHSSTKHLIESLKLIANNCQNDDLVCPGHGSQETIASLLKNNQIFASIKS